MIRKSEQTRERLQKYYEKRTEIDKSIEKLEKTLVEQENTEAGDMVRSYNLTIEELAEFLKSMKGHLPETEEVIYREDDKEELTETYDEI